MTPSLYNARTTVHEYGGGSYLAADDAVYFSNFDDQRLYKQGPGADSEPLTPMVDLRFTDRVMDRRRGRNICVREDHRDAAREAVNASGDGATSATPASNRHCLAAGLE